MIPPFTQQIKNKPTYFVERIWKGLPLTDKPIEHFEYEWDYQLKQSTHLIDWTMYSLLKPKKHTFREDKNDRWKVGTNIHFYINNQQPTMFQFAPVLPVVSTQKVEITWTKNEASFQYLGLEFDSSCIIKIDNKFFGDVYLSAGKVVTSSYNLPELAMNDGFDTLEDFLTYFKANFNGKIIHWTDLKY